MPANKSSASQREDEIRFALAPTKMHICNAVDHKIPFPLRSQTFSINWNICSQDDIRNTHFYEYYDIKNIRSFLILYQPLNTIILFYIFHVLLAKRPIITLRDYFTENENFISSMGNSSCDRFAPHSVEYISLINSKQFDGKSMFVRRTGCNTDTASRGFHCYVVIQPRRSIRKVEQLLRSLASVPGRELRNASTLYFQKINFAFPLTR